MSGGHMVVECHNFYYFPANLILYDFPLKNDLKREIVNAFVFGAFKHWNWYIDHSKIKKNLQDLSKK